MDTTNPQFPWKLAELRVGEVATRKSNGKRYRHLSPEHSKGKPTYIHAAEDMDTGEVVFLDHSTKFLRNLCQLCNVYTRENNQDYCPKCLGVFPRLCKKSMLTHWRNLKHQAPELYSDVFKVLRELRRNKIPPSPYIFKIKYKWTTLWSAQVFNELLFAGLIIEEKDSIQWKGIDMSDSSYGFITMAEKMSDLSLEQLLAKYSEPTS